MKHFSISPLTACNKLIILFFLPLVYHTTVCIWVFRMTQSTAFWWVYTMSFVWTVLFLSCWCSAFSICIIEPRVPSFWGKVDVRNAFMVNETLKCMDRLHLETVSEPLTLEANGSEGWGCCAQDRALMDLRVGVWRTEFRFNRKRGLHNVETDVEVKITMFS